MKKSDIVNIATQHVPESELPCRIEFLGSNNNRVYGNGTTWGGALDRVVGFIDGLKSTDPWTTITADPATLPPSGKEVMLSIWRKGKGHVISARWHAKQWLASGGYVVQELDGIPYAWQPWPTPPPYPSADSQEEGETK